MKIKTSAAIFVEAPDRRLSFLLQLLLNRNTKSSPGSCSANHLRSQTSCALHRSRRYSTASCHGNRLEVSKQDEWRLVKRKAFFCFTGLNVCVCVSCCGYRGVGRCRGYLTRLNTPPPPSSLESACVTRAYAPVVPRLPPDFADWPKVFKGASA